MIRQAVRAVLIVGALALGITLTDRTVPPTPVHRAEVLQAGDSWVRALRTGTGDTTLVLLHGYGEHLLTWRSVVDPLAERYAVVAFDLPGFGASEKPAGPYTLSAMSGRVVDFLARWTRPPVILVGHSMGGEIATEVALDRPDLVQGLILIAPAGLRIGLGPVSGRMEPAQATAIGVWEAARAFITPLHDPGWVSESDALAAYDPATDPAYRNSTAKVLEQFDFRGIGPRFSGLSQPTLILWGAEDPVIPVEVADSLAGMIPCHQLVRLGRTLHRPQFERPDTVVAVIKRFLAEPNCEITP